MTEQEFVQRVKDQNKKLYLSALSVVKNAADAEDAVASAVAYAWEKLADLRDEDRFDGWLLKITYTEAKKIKKRSRAYSDITELADAFSYEPQIAEFRAGSDVKADTYYEIHVRIHTVRDRGADAYPAVNCQNKILQVA